MIRINLLKPLQSPTIAAPMTELVPEPSKAAQKTLVWLLIFIAAGVGIYLAFENSKPVPTPPVVVSKPLPVVVPPKPAPAIVDTIDTIAGANAATLAHLLRDLLAATTPGLGFSKIEFTPPGEFHVHGVALTEDDLKHFQTALGATIGIELKADRVVSVGSDKLSREFFFSGKANYPVAKSDSVIHAIAENQISEALQDFASAAKQQNIDMEKPILKDSSHFQGKRAFHYTADARCDYSDLQILLGKLVTNRSSVAFRHVTLEARGEEKMAATFSLVFYAQ